MSQKAKPEIQKLIQKLPKAELHLHLDGSIRPRTCWEMCQNYNIPLPANDLEHLEELMMAPKDNRSLLAYLDRLDLPTWVIQYPITLRRISYEIAEDCFREGVRHLELRVAPDRCYMAGLSMEKMVESVLAGLKKAENDFKIKTGLILTAIRKHSPKLSAKIAKVAVEYMDRGVVAIDLSGYEMFPIRIHKRAFEIARLWRLPATVHAGEIGHPEDIWVAIEEFGTRRLGHALSAAKDKKLLKRLARDKIPIEVCLSSNLNSGVIEKVSDHPLLKFLEAGVPVVICADNRTISQTSLTQELSLAQQEFNLDLRTIKEIVRDSFKYAF